MQISSFWHTHMALAATVMWMSRVHENHPHAPMALAAAIIGCMKTNITILEMTRWAALTIWTEQKRQFKKEEKRLVHLSVMSSKHMTVSLVFSVNRAQPGETAVYHMKSQWTLTLDTAGLSDQWLQQELRWILPGGLIQNLKCQTWKYLYQQSTMGRWKNILVHVVQHDKMMWRYVHKRK